MAQKPTYKNSAPRICPHCQRRRLSYTSISKREERKRDEGVINEKGERQINKDKIREKDETGTDGEDPRVADLGRAIEDDFKLIKEKYGTPSLVGAVGRA